MVSSSRLRARPEGPVLELEQLVDRRARQARDPGDAVADLDDPADLLGPHRRACTRSTWRRSASVISLASIVSSAITALPLFDDLGRRSRRLRATSPADRCSRSPRAARGRVASTCRSPTCTTTPARRRRVQGHLQLDRRAGQTGERLGQGSGARPRRRRGRPDPGDPPAAGLGGLRSTSQSSVPTMSRARPPSGPRSADQPQGGPAAPWRPAGRRRCPAHGHGAGRGRPAPTAEPGVDSTMRAKRNSSSSISSRRGVASSSNTAAA